MIIFEAFLFIRDHGGILTSVFAEFLINQNTSIKSNKQRGCVCLDLQRYI